MLKQGFNLQPRDIGGSVCTDCVIQFHFIVVSKDTFIK